MSKTIVHACSSLLVRPNGIVRYINEVMELQRAQGHWVVFISDAKPTQAMAASQVFYNTEKSTYKPNMKDGHVWLQYDKFIADQIAEVYDNNALDADLVIAHDLHSYNALQQLEKDGIFIQHETDVLTDNSRYSYFDDEYIASQKDMVSITEWRIGMTVPSTNIKPKRPVYTPYPMSIEMDGPAERSRGLLYIGDSSVRKGAAEFMTVAKALNVTPTVIVHHESAKDPVFNGAKVYSFDLSQRAYMLNLIAQHKVAYIPSKNECPGIVVLECAQFMPTIVDGQYEWTKYVEGIARIETGDAIKNTIEFYLNAEHNDTYGRKGVEQWSKNAKQLWTNLST